MPLPTVDLVSPQTIVACRQRRSRLRPAMEAHGLHALLITSEKDIHYLTGFVGHESLAMVVRNGDNAHAIVISDARYDEFLQAWRDLDAAEIVMGTRHRLPESVAAACRARGIATLGVQAEHVTLAAMTVLTQTLQGVQLIAATGLISSLRMLKDELEISLIERAAMIAQDALTATLHDFQPGLSELELCARLEYEMKMRGAQASAFTPIIGAGPNSSIIHHMTGSSRIGADAGALLIDWGAMINGYNSDLTRTFAVGAMPAQLERAYEVVLEAQLAAIAGIQPGRTCAEIDGIARSIISDAGYGQFFGHGLGHGLGMDVHEGPYFNNLQTDVLLQPGMVMTVEPGIYLPGVGGVRIEDDVLVTDDGCRVLTNYPKDFDSAALCD